MLWHNLRLRHRMLIGYGVMLALFAALALFFILRTNSLNTQIRSLSAEVATEAAVGTRLANAVAATQQAVDRYLQQPAPENLRTATDAQQRLATTIQEARAALVSPQQRPRLDVLGARLVTYQSSFQALNGLLETQHTTQTRLNANLSDAITTLNGTIYSGLSHSGEIRERAATSPASHRLERPLDQRGDGIPWSACTQ
jgi:hypothetical protein